MKTLIIFMLFFSFLNSSEWKIQNDPYYKHKVDQFNMLKNSSKLETMMLGDSITDEGRWSELLGYMVENRGISGDTTQGVIDRLYTLSPTIKKVYLMIGVNDIMRNFDFEEIYSNYIKIVESLRAKNIEVVVQSTLYIGEKRKKDFNQKVEELNKRLKIYTKNNSIKFIDLNSKLAPEKVLLKEFSQDSLHLNAKAYEIWTNEIKSADK